MWKKALELKTGINTSRIISVTYERGINKRLKLVRLCIFHQKYVVGCCVSSPFVQHGQLVAWHAHDRCFSRLRCIVCTMVLSCMWMFLVIQIRKFKNCISLLWHPRITFTPSDLTNTSAKLRSSSNGIPSSEFSTPSKQATFFVSFF